MSEATMASFTCKLGTQYSTYSHISIEVFPGEKVVVHTLVPIRYVHEASTEKLVGIPFAVGSEAVLEHGVQAVIGTIIKITACRVSIRSHQTGCIHSLTFKKFALFNERPVAASHARNVAWTDWYLTTP
jgi:hypothetical protein